MYGIKEHLHIGEIRYVWMWCVWTYIYTVCPNKKETRFFQWDFFIATQYLINLIIKGIFSSFIWYQTHDDISMHDWKGTIYTHACQTWFAQNNGIELQWPISD